MPGEERGEDSSIVSSDIDGMRKKPAAKIPSASSRGTGARGRGRGGGRGRGRGRAKNKPQPVPNLVPKKRKAEDEDIQDEDDHDDEEPIKKKPASKKPKGTPAEESKDSKSFELNNGSTISINEH